MKDFFRQTALRTTASEKYCLHRSGCKGKGFSDNFQIFLNIFSKNFLKNLARLKHILHQSGCKVTSYFCNKQIIFKLFYSFFSTRNILLCIVGNCVRRFNHIPASGTDTPAFDHHRHRRRHAPYMEARLVPNSARRGKAARHIRDISAYIYIIRI